MCDFKVMNFFFADEPTRLPWLEIGGMGRSIQRCLEEPSKAQAPGFLDAVLFATDGKKHHIYPPRKLTWNLKLMVSNRNLNLPGVHFQVPC